MAMSWWCNPNILSSVIPFFTCLQSFPASGSLQISQLFESGGQSIGVSPSASVLPMNIQDWFPLGLTSLMSLQFKGLSRVYNNTIVQKHQFLGTQLSFWSNFHIHIWLLEKPQLWRNKPLLAKSLLFNMLSRLVRAFQPRNKCLIISWLMSPSAVILEPKKIKSVTVSIVFHLFAMKLWDWMPWSYFFECWVFFSIYFY